MDGNSSMKEPAQTNSAEVVLSTTKTVAVYTLVGTVLMWIVFAILHFLEPDFIPLDYTVFLGGIGGSLVAIANFYWLGCTVQKVCSTTDEDLAKKLMRASYSQRNMMQILWVIVAIVTPFFWFVTGIIPLFFPTLGIKVVNIINFSKKK